jgi:hypothetical protein
MKMEVSMRMHVSSPKVPKCICYATNTQKVTFISIQKVVSKTKRISSGLRDQIIHDRQETFGRVQDSSQNFGLITTNITHALRNHSGRCLSKALH